MCRATSSLQVLPLPSYVYIATACHEETTLHVQTRCLICCRVGARCGSISRNAAAWASNPVELPDAAGLGLPDRDLYILMHDIQQVPAACHLERLAVQTHRQLHRLHWHALGIVRPHQHASLLDSCFSLNDVLLRSTGVARIKACACSAAATAGLQTNGRAVECPAPAGG